MSLAQAPPSPASASAKGSTQQDDDTMAQAQSKAPRAAIDGARPIVGDAQASLWSANGEGPDSIDSESTICSGYRSKACLSL